MLIEDGWPSYMKVDIISAFRHVAACRLDCVADIVRWDVVREALCSAD